MAQSLSKVRARNTRRRERQAGRSARTRYSPAESPGIGMGIALVFWLAASATLGLEFLLAPARSMQDLFQWSAQAAFLLLGMLAAGLFLEIIEPAFLRRNDRVAMLCLLLLVTTVPAKPIMLLLRQHAGLPLDLTALLLPLALPAMLTTILAGARVAIPVGVWAALFIAIPSEWNMPVLITGIVATMVAARCTQHVRTRARVFRIGIIIGLCEIGCVFAMTVLRGNGLHDSGQIQTLHLAAACLLSGGLSAAGALLLLPLFESLFRITTDITLLEASDLGNPLLQRLAMQAPGTYHHSLVVASLAQAAADEISANSLEARVCAYYHDIGKLTKPDFFSENIRMSRNPHDDLPPSMSTLVIMAHVKEGVSLAEHHRLPDPIVRGIREHHGTSLISCFHQKAKSQLELEYEFEGDGTANSSARVEEGDFRYPGPKPSTAVSAILSLADAVEAASRSLDKQTPGHIDSMVGDIIFARMEDGQLDDSGLTLTEITQIRRSFVFTLTSMLHGRVPYPKDEHRDSQPTKTTGRQKEPTAAAAILGKEAAVSAG